MSDGLVDVLVEEPAWLDRLPDLEDVAARAAEMALEGAGLRPDGYAISVLACDDDRIAALNGEFRGRRAPTNVLSWPAFGLAPREPGKVPAAPPAAPGNGRLALGDVAIALQTAAREAKTAEIPLKSHVLHLILHACLHLLGYDHERPADADVMERIESRALERAGIADPYA